MIWSLAWGEVDKHQNLLIPHPPLGACSLQLVPLQAPADSISLPVLLPTLSGFGYKFIFIKKKSAYVQCFAVPISFGVCFYFGKQSKGGCSYL